MNLRLETNLKVQGILEKVDNIVRYSKEGSKAMSLFGALSKSLFGTSKKRMSMARKVGYSLNDALGLPDCTDPAPSILQLVQQTSLLPLILDQCSSLFSTDIVVLELTSPNFLSPMFQKSGSAFSSTIYLERLGPMKFREVKLQEPPKA